MGYGQYSREPKPMKPSKPVKTNKRERHVFETGKVPHVWAHPLQSDGSGYAQTDARNPQNNLFFKTDRDGTRVLYSYRESYPIGSRFVVKRKPVFLIRSGSAYSTTTAGHMNMAAGAARNNGKVFEVPYVTRHNFSAVVSIHGGGIYGTASPDTGAPNKETHTANLADYAERIALAIRTSTAAVASRNIEYYHSEACNLTAQAKAYAKFFRLKLPKLPVVPAINQEKLAAKKQREAVRAAAKTEQRKRDREDRDRQNAEKLTQWKQGADVYIRSYGEFALLRVVRPSSNAEPSGHTLCAVVQTSQGVDVPVSGRTGAARLLAFLEAIKAAGRTYQRNGHTEHIGNFTVESFAPVKQEGSVNPEYILTAGCHRIKWSEIDSVADAIRDAAQQEDGNLFDAGVRTVLG
jgi:hypothetical protein